VSAVPARMSRRCYEETAPVQFKLNDEETSYGTKRAPHVSRYGSDIEAAAVASAAAAADWTGQNTGVQV